MISASYNNKTNPSFTSIVPVKVFIDGKEAIDPKYIRSACRQLSTILVGPAKNTEFNTGIVKEFAKHDVDYSFYGGMNGFPKDYRGKVTPSNYFRCICDRVGNFLFTGIHAERLNQLGKSVGAERFSCKTREIADSFDLQVAKSNYGQTISRYINLPFLRMTETYDNFTKQRLGKPVVLNINMKSNGKYGLSTFKTKLDSIGFTYA